LLTLNILRYALQIPDPTPREHAYTITVMGKFSISESSVYRVNKRNGLFAKANEIAVRASKEYIKKTKMMRNRRRLKAQTME